jgi:uncharacterized protein YndB with AHSA1/START domain
MRSTLLIFILLCSMLAGQLTAGVADQSSEGFTIRITTFVLKAPPELVYDRLVHHVGDWWNPEHTISQDAHNLSLDDKPMGCFCEKLPSNGGVRHAEVIMVMPNKLLVMSGALGPLQKFGTTGTMTIVLTPVHKDTRIELVYAVGGYLPGGLNTWAAPVDQVLAEQMTRLKNYIETGSPVRATDRQP